MLWAGAWQHDVGDPPSQPRQLGQHLSCGCHRGDQQQGAIRQAGSSHAQLDVEAADGLQLEGLGEAPQAGAKLLQPGGAGEERRQEGEVLAGSGVIGGIRLLLLLLLWGVICRESS